MNTMSENTKENTKNQSKPSREELLQLINMSECAMFVARPGAQMELLYANDRFYSMVQYSKKEFEEECENSVMSLILPDDKQKMRTLIARQTAAGGKLQLEQSISRKEGSPIWVSISAHSVMVDGQLLYYASCLDITESKRNLAEAYKAKRDVELIANSIPGGVIKIRMTDFKLLYANDGFYRLSGYSKEEYHVNFGDYCDKVLHPSDRDMVWKQVKTAVENSGLIGFEYRIVAKTGEDRWTYVNGCRVDDDEGQPVYLCVLMDITKRKKLETEFEESACRAEEIAKFMRETTWTYEFETGRLSRVGNLGETYSNESVLEGVFDNEHLNDFLHPDDVERFRKALQRRRQELGGHKGIYRVKDSYGEYRRMEIGSISVSTDGGDKPNKVFGVTRLLEGGSLPASEAEVVAEEYDSKLENKLVRMAKSSQAKAADTLTGMVSYAKFLQRAGELLAERTDDMHYALLCADIDEFSKFSYHYGFSISNEILKRLSKVMQRYVKNKGVCARVDGDYFVAIFSYENHKELLKTLSEMMHYQDELKNKETQITFDTTNGLYLVEPQDNDLGEMLEKADLARRNIKGIKGNHYAIYTDDLQKQRFTEEKIIQAIHDAMEKQTVEISYLPRIGASKEEIVGCKAVARIQLSDGQYLQSDAILRYIERSGKLNKFSFYILDQVCCNIGAWKALGNDVIPFSVEMTASQLSARNSLSMIQNIVEKQNNLEPKDLIIEINERYFADITSAMQITLERLCKKGYQVVISRFGSHHTALHSLRRIPVTGIKFHGEYFTENVDTERERVVMKHITQMATELGMTVCCGAVRTQLQEKYARDIGCHMLEGELFYGAMQGNVFEKCFLS